MHHCAPVPSTDILKHGASLAKQLWHDFMVLVVVVVVEFGNVVLLLSRDLRPVPHGRACGNTSFQKETEQAL